MMLRLEQLNSREDIMPLLDPISNAADEIFDNSALSSSFLAFASQPLPKSPIKAVNSQGSLMSPLDRDAHESPSQSSLKLNPMLSPDSISDSDTLKPSGPLPINKPAAFTNAESNEHKAVVAIPAASAASQVTAMTTTTKTTSRKKAKAIVAANPTVPSSTTQVPDFPRNANVNEKSSTSQEIAKADAAGCTKSHEFVHLRLNDSPQYTLWFKEVLCGLCEDPLGGKTYHFCSSKVCGYKVCKNCSEKIILQSISMPREKRSKRG
jgi:hypothetical protein